MKVRGLGNRWLAARTKGVWHGEDVEPTTEHPDLPVLVSNWGSKAQPQSRRAKSAVEPHLREYLTRARLAGRRAGVWAGLVVAVLLSVLLLVVAFLLPKIG